MRRTRKIKKISLPAGNGKKLAFSTVLAAGIAMIMLIIITAYSAGVRYDINCMIKENQALMGEIENLQVKLYSASNIDYVEGISSSTGEVVRAKFGENDYTSLVLNTPTYDEIKDLSHDELLNFDVNKLTKYIFSKSLPK